MKPNGLKNIEDFMTDDLFVEWVLTPTEQNISFWAMYFADFPEQISLVEEAKEMVLQLNEIEQITAKKGDIEGNWKIIEQQTIKQELIEQPRLVPTIQKETSTRKIYNWRYISGIASLFFLAFLSYQFFQIGSTNEATISAAPTMEWHELKNTTAVATSLFLSDGSQVILEPFSSLKYPNLFLKKQREVVLKGEAFFDIARDTTQPFVVYANETITKVLGTSFTIKAFEGQKEVEVAVKTGKVAVYANVSSLPKKIIKEKEKFVIRTDEQILIPIPNKKLEVTPNQRVVFDKVKADMQKAVVKLPLPIKPVKQLPKFHFKEEPVAEVLKILGEAYELEMNYKQAKLDKCLITTTLEDVSLFAKLDIICQAMGLTYKEKAAAIYIYGGDCD